MADLRLTLTTNDLKLNHFGTFVYDIIKWKLGILEYNVLQDLWWSGYDLMTIV